MSAFNQRMLTIVLIVRDPGCDLDAIPAVRERNIRQVNPESRTGVSEVPEGTNYRS